MTLSQLLPLLQLAVGPVIADVNASLVVLRIGLDAHESTR